jgi:hypothetical protein
VDHSPLWYLNQDRDYPVRTVHLRRLDEEGSRRYPGLTRSLRNMRNSVPCKPVGSQFRVSVVRRIRHGAASQASVSSRPRLRWLLERSSSSGNPNRESTMSNDDLQWEKGRTNILMKSLRLIDNTKIYRDQRMGKDRFCSEKLDILSIIFRSPHSLHAIEETPDVCEGSSIINSLVRICFWNRWNDSISDKMCVKTTKLREKFHIWIQPATNLRKVRTVNSDCLAIPDWRENECESMSSWAPKLITVSLPNGRNHRFSLWVGN